MLLHIPTAKPRAAKARIPSASALVSIVAIALTFACSFDDDSNASLTDASTDSPTLDGYQPDVQYDAKPDGKADADAPATDASGAQDASTDDTATDVIPDVVPDVIPDVVPDVIPDVVPDVIPDVVPDVIPDVVPDVVLDVVTDIEPDSPGAGNIVVRLTKSTDAVASYLMQVSPSAWNMFWGTSVPIGRHFDTTMGSVSYYTALRFTNVTIPKGAKITSSKLRFYPTNEVDSSHSLWINIYAERTDNSAPIDTSNYDSGRPDQRLRTTSFIDHWLVRCNASCTDLTEYDCPQRKLDCWNRNVAFEVPKDLSSMVQEVVNLAGWKPGNALTILLVNAARDEDGEKYKSSRSITSFDDDRGPGFAPQLAISFESP